MECEMIMKILLVITGGTISTTEKEGVLGIHGDSPYLILKQFRASSYFDQKVEFETISPVLFLSECNQPEYLETLYYAILKQLSIAGNMEELLKKGLKPPQKLPYDAILVTHGSDTLSYTGAFFAESFLWLGIPMALTASDAPLSDPYSNGMENFSGAVRFLQYMVQAGHRGVYVIWKNSGEKQPAVFPAGELLEADTYADHFTAYKGQPCGYIPEMGEKWDLALPEEEFENREIPIIHMENSVLFLRPYPGLRYDCIDLTGIRAVVHYLYHSATACTQERYGGPDQGIQYNILSFLRRCGQQGICVYLAGFKSAGQRLYETNNEILRQEMVKPLYGLSPERAYMRILVQCNLYAWNRIDG